MAITRVDVDNRMVWARLDETPGISGDVMDYASSKPNFVAWSQRMAKASGGLNFGNVRAMHSRKAAGMVKSMECDDATKSILFGIAITDDAELNNCAVGLYNGISPGGRMRKFVQNSQIRFEARPDELSLVDAPDNPAATFLVMAKAAGQEEERSFALPVDVDAIVQDMAKCVSPADLSGLVLSLPTTTIVRMFGNEGERAPDQVMEKRAFSAADRRAATVSGEALPDGSFPVASRDDLLIAVQAVGRAADPAAAQAHLINRATVLGALDALPPAWVAADVPMRKGISDVGCIASIIQNIGWLARGVTEEAAEEGDGSPVPAKIAVWLRDGVAILVDMASEETAELIAKVSAQVAALPVLVAVQAATEGDAGDGSDAVLMVDPADLMAKAAGMGRIVSMAAELAQLRADTTEAMAKFAGQRDQWAAERQTLSARVAELEALPAAGGPARRAPAQMADATREAIDAMPPGIARAQAEMAQVLGAPSIFNHRKQ